MTQTWTDDPYVGTGKTADAVMEDVNENFAAIKSSFSGASSPPSPVGGMPWHDSTARKVRNYDNTAWLASLMGDASQKMWVYRNDTCEGWLVDSSVTDRVLSLKGGTNAYNVNGGVGAGTWTVSGHSHGVGTYAVPAHVHQWYKHGISSLDDQTYNSSGAAVDIEPVAKQAIAEKISVDNVSITESLPDSYTEAKAATAITGTSAAVASASTYRPAAAVGTLQYPDLS